MRGYREGQEGRECTTLLLRTLYEGEEQGSFHESLATRIKGHERDIERMCNKNYQGFIESVSELLKVKNDAMKLKVMYSAVERAYKLPAIVYCAALCPSTHTHMI